MAMIELALNFDSDDPTLHLSIDQGDILHNPLHNSPHAAGFDGAEPIARLHGLAQHQAEVGGLHVHVMMLTKKPLSKKFKPYPSFMKDVLFTITFG